jgi:ABC-type amino acid transport substrate-binding protein
MNRINRILNRSAALLLTLVVAAVFLPAARAEDSGKVVRVGWYESPFNSTDELGRRSGYAYEYQQKIAAYTGWMYEYVEGGWPVLMEMLADGRIDLMSDVSFTEERTENMLYSSLPMGEEDYYLFISPSNEEITKEDYSTLNGKRVGVNKGSVQAGLFREWAASHGVRAELVELTGQEAEHIALLNRGEIDLYLAVEACADAERAVPVCRIGASDFYFAVSKARPELLTALNAAIEPDPGGDPYFNQRLHNKYLRTSSANLFLTADEKAWLAGTAPFGWAIRTTIWRSAPRIKKRAS